MNMIDNLRKLIEKSKITRDLPELEKIEEIIFNLISNFTNCIKDKYCTERQGFKHEIDQLYNLDELITKIIINITSPIKPIPNSIVFNSTHLKLRGN